VALVIYVGTASAALSVYTTAASFDAASVFAATDGFGDTSGEFIASPSRRVAGSYRYTVSSPLGLFGGGTSANPWLTTNLAGDTMTFSGFAGGVSAIGGSFFGSDDFGTFLAGQSVTLTATDSFGAIYVQSMTDVTQTSFVGFVSNGTLVSLALDIGNPRWFASVDNLVLAAVPESEPYAVLLVGLCAVSVYARRRRGLSW
jgi:hypothetical protein